MPRIGPLVAYPLTPRGEDGRLLTASFERLVDGSITAGANAVGVLGSTGGFAYMPRTARKRITRSAVEVADGRVPVIVGVGALSTAEVLANLAEAHSVGASGALLQPMAYQPLTFDEIYGLYKDASAATEIPLWVYNNPSTTGHRFSVEELTKIGRLSAVAGFKDSAANATDAKDRMERIAAAMPPRTAKQIDWGFSGDGLGAQVLLAGATTWHSGLAGVLPEICVAIAQAAASGHAPHARVLQRQLTPLSIIVRQYGGIRTAHSVAQMLGLDAGVLPRPLAPLPADARALVRMALDGIAVPEAPSPAATTSTSATSTPRPDSEKPADTKAADTRPTDPRPTDPPATDTAAADTVTTEPGIDQPSTEHPSADQPSIEQPSAEQPAAVESAGAEPTVAEPVATLSAPEPREPQARRARRPEPTKTGAVSVTPEPAQQVRPAPVRSDAGATVPPPRSLGRSRAEQPRRARTRPTPVSEDDAAPVDETASGRAGRHSG